MGNCSSKCCEAEEVGNISPLDLERIDSQIREARMREAEEARMTRERTLSTERPSFAIESIHFPYYIHDSKAKKEDNSNINKNTDFSYKGISKGKRVEIISDGRRGVVSFIGNIDYNKKTQDEAVVGICLDEQYLGETDGSLDGTVYFRTEQNRGIFRPVSDVRLITNENKSNVQSKKKKVAVEK